MAQVTIDQAFQLGVQHHQTGRFVEAEATYRQILQQAPYHASAMHLLGALAGQTDRSAIAIELISRALEIDPSLVEAYRNLAVVMSDNDRLDEAIALLQKAIRIDPTHAHVHSSLAVALAQIGQLDEAIATFRRAVELSGGDAHLQSNLVYAVQFHPDYDSAAILEESREWSRQHEQPIARERGHSFGNNRSPERRLRIGYVSSNFSGHVVGRNALPLLQNHTGAAVEIFCYSNSSRVDDISRRFFAAANHWRQIETTDDSKTVEPIRNDGIDILVDLSLHLAENRLTVFARKPAPVQVTFAGYPGTTGLCAIDYRLTDPYLDPPCDCDSCYSERSVRLPNSFWCYDPQAMQPADELPIAPLPALASGHVTFGSLNDFRKVNEGVLELWSRVLAAIPESRLILLVPRGNSRRRVLNYLNSRQVQFVDRQDRAAYLKTFDRIDIGFDTFPYNGHTTSLDSLWMGIPVVTLIGRTVVGRAGWSQLCNLDLRDLAAETPAKFIEIATRLATDLPRLSELRQGLRDRMRRSPLMDAKGFARQVETAYRTMWRQWCREAEQ